jgi:hypothetical protein
MNELAIRQNSFDLTALANAAELLAEGKMFFNPKTGQPLNKAEIYSIVEYGRELGIEPVIALMNISPVKGRLCTSAGLMLAMAVQAGVKYRVLREERDACSIQFDRDGQTYISTFDSIDAQQAGLLNKDNWKNYPKAMYKARAIANGCRYMVPDKLAGLYLQEEIADVKTPSNDVRITSATPGLPMHIEEDSATELTVEPIKQHNPVEGGTITDRQKNKIHAMFGAQGINVYENIFKEYLYEIGIIHEDRKVGGLSKTGASHLIEILVDDKIGKTMTDFYYEDKYHDELKEAFAKASKLSRVKLLLNMAPLIEDLGTLPKKITDELTDQQTYDYFSLFLRAIHNEEDNRRQGGSRDIVNDAIKLFDASVVATKESPVTVTEDEDKYEFDALSF